MNEVKLFCTALTPYRKKYVRYVNDDEELLFPRWFMETGYLSDEMILSAITGKTILAYLSVYQPRAIGLDIDDHKGRGDGYLLRVYDQVAKRMRGRPSLVAKSPHGLHCWYLLIAPFPSRILEEKAKERLNGLPVEVRPTPSTGLRIPAETNLLDPHTLLPLHKPFADAVNDALDNRCYHVAEIFGEEGMPEAIRESLRTRKRRLAYGSVMRVEQEIYPILPGTSNEALKKLVPVYRSAGFTVEQATARIHELLAPVYDGELRNWQRLYKRVQSFYKKSPEYYEKPKREQLPLFAESIAEAVAKRWDEGRRRGKGVYHVESRREGIRKLVAGILRWREWVTAVVQSPGERSAWNYIYPFFAKNMREGFIPLPRNYLRKLDPNYHRIMPFLVETGFLEPSPYPYVPGAGIAKYYRVHDEEISKIS